MKYLRYNYLLSTLNLSRFNKYFKTCLQPIINTCRLLAFFLAKKIIYLLIFYVKIIGYIYKSFSYLYEFS